MRPSRPPMSLSGAVAMVFLFGALTATAEVREPDLLARVETAATQHHKDPALLVTARDEFERAIAQDPRVERLLALSRLWLITGDRSALREDKLAAYARARQLGRHAIDSDPRSAAAHFWYTVSTARWGHTQGVLRSMRLLGEVKRGIATVLELDPKFTRAYALAGYVDYEVPPLLGGSVARAEEMFRKGIELDPHFTTIRIGLAKTLIQQGRLDEARTELHRVLTESSPTNTADWTLEDAPEARRLLDVIAASI